jgi:hypothetical protein
MAKKRRKLSEAKLAAMAGARNARHPGKRPAANEHEDQPAAAANKPGPEPGSKPKTELELLGSATNTPSMPRKRKSPAGFSPFVRAGISSRQARRARLQTKGGQADREQREQAGCSQRRSGQNGVHC